MKFLRNWLGTLGITIKMLPRSATGNRKYIVDQNLIPILQQYQAKHKQAKKPTLVLSPVSYNKRTQQAIYEETLLSNTFQEVIEKLQTLLSSSLPSKSVG